MCLCGCAHACDCVCTSQRRKEGLPHLEAGPCSYLAGEPPGQAPPLMKPHPGTVPRASLMAPSPPGDLGSPCPGRVPGGARLPSELAPAAVPSALPSRARGLWGLERPAPPPGAQTSLGQCCRDAGSQRSPQPPSGAVSSPGAEAASCFSPPSPPTSSVGKTPQKQGLTCLAEDSGEAGFRAFPQALPRLYSMRLQMEQILWSEESSMPPPTTSNEGAAARTPRLASLPGWTPSGTPAPQAKPGSRVPLRHCALSEASDLNLQGGPAQIQQFPGKPTPSSGACLWWAHFIVWGIFKAPPCGLCASFLLSCGSVCFHRLDPPHSPTL